MYSYSKIAVYALLVLVLSITSNVPSNSQNVSSGESRFMKYPNISGDKIVFTFDGDLWLGSINMEYAVKMTNHPGDEINAKFSPDGNKIAFTGDYAGSNNVFLINTENFNTGAGTPLQLTYNSGCMVLGWSPDGQKVIFRNTRESDYRGITRVWSVSEKAEMPEALAMPRAVLAAVSPDGKKIAYNPRGREEYYWKRYKGGQFLELWLYETDTKKFTKLTDFVGKNAYPMWLGNDLYFVSDRGENGISNIYKMDLNTKQATQVTFHKDFDVQMPSTDGKRIVYMMAGYVHIFDPKDNSVKKISFKLPDDNWKLAERTINPAEYIQTFNVSNDGKTAIFDARGDVFTTSVKSNGDIPFNHTNTSGIRERFPQLSPDGKWIAYFSEKSGEYELYMRENVKGKSEEIQLTKGMNKTVYHLEWSPDSKKILFGNKDFTLFFIDINSKKLTAIDSSKQLKNDQFYWEISDYTWSPDSKWIAYSYVQYNRNNQVFLYNIETGKRTAVTSDFYDCMNPTFDPDGNFLYYLTYQDFRVRMDIFEDNHIINHPVQIMALQLKAGEKPPFTEEIQESEFKMDFHRKDADDYEKDKKELKKADFRIDLDGIQKRAFTVPVKSGNYFYLKAAKGKITFASVDGYEGGEYRGVFYPRAGEKWDLNFFNLKDRKTFTINDKISDWKITPNGEYIMIKKSRDYYINSISELQEDKSLKDKINLSQMYYTVNPLQEWLQIFNDTWRWYRDFFYDANFHGKNWMAHGEKFRKLLPDIRSRQDLNWLMSQMVGELCVSHTYVGGGDMFSQSSFRNPQYTGYLGCDYTVDKSGYYKISKIYGPTEFNQSVKSPLTNPDVNVKEGDYLIAINGNKIKYPDNIYKYMQIVPGEKVTISTASSPGEKGQDWTITPLDNEYSLRYERWIEDNINYLKKETNDEVGYMHLTAMGDQNVGQFDKYWRAFRYKKGLVIDVRGNGGGWTEYFMIDKLERNMVAYNCVRDMELFRYPGTATNGKIVVLTNENNGSDGEAFVEHFKARKLGTVVGTPSWGGLVGILNGQQTIDNGSVEQSNNAFYGKEGKWLVENHGADPDIYIENDPQSILDGKDNQMDKAIEVLKKQIKDDPFVFPSKPEIKPR